MDPVARRLTSPTFVGRSGELGVLGSALERAAAGRPAFAFVGGESGVGKTRLLREFETRARAAGAHVLIGQCLELAGEQIPYAPVVGALRPLARDGTSLRTRSRPGRATRWRSCSRSSAAPRRAGRARRRSTACARDACSRRC